MVLFKYKKKQMNRGFSLPELMVSLGIITIVTSILMFKYSAFNNTTLLSSQAYEIALDLRQAQAAGVSVQGGNNSSAFDKEYGIYFSTELGKNKQYVFFRDNDNSNEVQYDRPDEQVYTYNLDSRFYIERICLGVRNGPDYKCNGNGNSVNDLHVSFRRPNFDPRLYSGSHRDQVTVVIGNESGIFKGIVITETGQIYVQ